MTYKQKLRELLKTVPEVKEQMEKLDFWCKVNYLLSDWSTDIWIYCFQLWLKMFLTDSWLEVENSNILEIIWLPLQERFIRIYCQSIVFQWDFIFLPKKEQLFTSNSWLEIVTKLDNTKDFDNQSEEVYQKIYEVLYDLKK